MSRPATETPTLPELRPDEGLRFAAVDVGSNALRLLFTSVFDRDGDPVFRKVSLLRMPLRLGTEAFLQGRLGAETESRLLHTLQGFSSLIKAWQPLRWRACATSALRSLVDSDSLMRRLNLQCDLDLQCITGEEEAGLILENERSGLAAREQRCLFIDVGGGSTEVTFFGGEQPSCSRSFPLGTVRLLHGQDSPLLWEDLKKWLKRNRPESGVLAMGSGGNINKLYSISSASKGELLELTEIRARAEEIEALDIPRRIRDLGLRPDRADVMPHALRIYTYCMKHGRAERMMVPRTGLADGLVRSLYEDYRRENPL